MEDWRSARPILRGEIAFEPTPPTIESPPLLSPRERRRTSPIVRLALSVAHQATVASGFAPEDVTAVFASACGDGATLTQLLTTLANPDGMVSPTQFHNSVHNAAIGYWSIATGSKLPATSIAAHDYTFAAGLLKAAMQALTYDAPVLAVFYDLPFPEPLHSMRPLTDMFAVAMVLTHERQATSLAHVEANWRAGADEPPNPPHMEALHPLWEGNPAARALPLLEALARGDSAELIIRYPQDGALRLKLGE